MALSAVPIPSASNSKVAEVAAEEVDESLRERWLGELFPSLRLVDLDGEAIELDSLRGSVVVLNFWFLACPPCLAEIPKLNTLVQEHAEAPVSFYALTFDEAPSVREFLAEHSFDYQVICTTLDELESLGVSTYPSHLVIDGEGRVTSVITGYESGAQLGAALAKAVGAVERAADPNAID